MRVVEVRWKESKTTFRRSVMNLNLVIFDRTKKACNALKHLGISAKAIRLALKRLLKAYENNWIYIEEENYKVLIDAIFEPEEPMVLDKPILVHLLNNKHLRFDNEEPDFNFCEDPDDKEIEPLRKKPRTQNRPSVLTGSSVPCASEMQQMVKHDFRAMDILERDMPKLGIVSKPVEPQNQHDKNESRTIPQAVYQDLDPSGMLTRAMAKELSVASAHECIYVDFLSKEEHKKVSGADKHPGWVDAMQRN
ncbi:retrovirus-related pol polyprotein from transposon TNT 1-94 [Tanacetum coccineum]